MTSMKDTAAFEIPLAEVTLTDADNIHEIYSQKFTDNHKKTGLKMTDIGRGILFERPGFADVLIYPQFIKRAIALEDFVTAAEAKRVAQEEANAKEKARVEEAAAQARIKREAEEAAKRLQLEAKAKRDAERAAASSGEPVKTAVPPPVAAGSAVADLKAAGRMTEEEERSMRAAEARANKGRK